MTGKSGLLQSIALRPASEGDISFLYDLHVATMKSYIDQTWGWDDAFQDSLFKKNYVPAEFQVITFDGADIGMLSIEEREAEIFLRTIKIHPNYQNKGIGTAIISKMIAEGTLRMKPVGLRVLKVNPAKKLYDRLGFSTIEETDTHYIMLTAMPK
jgi:ribosomal protein S18 acetylase RimI-like enzyme